MTPQEHAKLEAEHEEHMAKWCAEQAHTCLAGTAHAAVLAVAEQHRESARYWRSIVEE